MTIQKSSPIDVDSISPTLLGFRYGAWSAPTHCSAADIVRYEHRALGNTIHVDPTNMNALAALPAHALVWITRTRSAAARYRRGREHLRTLTLPHAISIGTDGNGGLLVVRDGRGLPLTSYNCTPPAPRELAHVGRRVCRAINRSHFYHLLDAHGYGCATPTAGACLVIADALQHVLGYGTLVIVWGRLWHKQHVGSSLPHAQHAMLQVGDGYLDGDGFHPYDVHFRRRWETENRATIDNILPAYNRNQLAVDMDTIHNVQLRNQLVVYFQHSL